MGKSTSDRKRMRFTEREMEAALQLIQLSNSGDSDHDRRSNSDSAGSFCDLMMKVKKEEGSELRGGGGEGDDETTAAADAVSAVSSAMSSAAAAIIDRGNNDREGGEADTDCNSTTDGGPWRRKRKFRSVVEIYRITEPLIAR